MGQASQGGPRACVEGLQLAHSDQGELIPLDKAAMLTGIGRIRTYKRKTGGLVQLWSYSL